jgi:PKHD-type hydroxylase
MFLEVADVLKPDEIARLRAIAQTAPFVDGRVSNPHASMKNNLQLDHSNAAFQEASKLLQAALMRSESMLDFAFPNVIAPPQLTKHEAGMAYGPHSDTPFMSVGQTRFRTDLSCTIFLSDPESYVGGELCIHLGDKPVLFKLPAGSAILYPSTTLHEVRPVTAGTRLVGITFIESRISNANHRELLYELKEVDALEGLSMKMANRIRLIRVISSLHREWS